MTPCRSLERGRDTRRKSLIDDEQDHRFLAHSKGKGSVHGKVEGSLDLVGGEWKGEAGSGKLWGQTLVEAGLWKAAGRRPGWGQNQ